MATKTFMTVEQYVALGEDPPGVRYELSDGELLVTPSANFHHHKIQNVFVTRLESFLSTHPLGEVTSELDYQLGEGTVRRPDVAFISNNRLEGVDTNRTPLAAAPDLVIEIISPTDRAADLMKKVSEYLKAGVQSVWLFYPSLLKAYRYTNTQTETVLSGDEFVEPELMPGFVLKISDIFGWSRRS